LEFQLIIDSFVEDVYYIKVQLLILQIDVSVIVVPFIMQQLSQRNVNVDFYGHFYERGSQPGWGLNPGAIDMWPTTLPVRP